MGVTSESDGAGFTGFPKSLSVWWSEETEYVLQRIERWAAYARGYNRLRSVRLSPGRMTMSEEYSRPAGQQQQQEQSWMPAATFRRSQQQNQEDRGKPPAEQARLRCCALGNLDYKSNGNLDSNCLEAYSLDHSIYFKTIGEIRSELRPVPDIQKSSNRVVVNGVGVGGAGVTTPIDCGDFLSSDFDELDDDLGEDIIDDFDRELGNVVVGCASYQLATSEDYALPSSDACSNDLVRVCRTGLVDLEDELNNNNNNNNSSSSSSRNSNNDSFMMMAGYPRKFAAAAQ